MRTRLTSPRFLMWLFPKRCYSSYKPYVTDTWQWNTCFNDRNIHSPPEALNSILRCHSWALQRREIWIIGLHLYSSLTTNLHAASLPVAGAPNNLLCTHVYQVCYNQNYLRGCLSLAPSVVLCSSLKHLHLPSYGQRQGCHGCNSSVACLLVSWHMSQSLLKGFKVKVETLKSS